jgi:hypothetical protein
VERRSKVAARLRAKLLALENDSLKSQTQTTAVVLANGNPRFRGNQNKSGIVRPTDATGSPKEDQVAGDPSDHNGHGVAAPEPIATAQLGNPEIETQAPELGTQAPATQAPAMPVPTNAQPSV